MHIRIEKPEYTNIEAIQKCSPFTIVFDSFISEMRVTIQFNGKPFQ